MSQCHFRGTEVYVFDDIVSSSAREAIVSKWQDERAGSIALLRQIAEGAAGRRCPFEAPGKSAQSLARVSDTNASTTAESGNPDSTA